jgi:uncharacterized damage-inducible protein DinB
VGLHRHLTRLIRYNGWANSHILDQALKVLPEQPSYSGQYGGLADELLHIVRAEEFWLGSWRGEAVHDTANPSAAQLVAAFARAQTALERYIAGLDESDLAATFTRVGSDHTISAPLADLIEHLVGHNTYHRGGIALVLTREGVSPGDIDLYDFILQGG